MATNCCSRRARSELHLIDVENLMGTPWFTHHAVADLRRTYDAVSGAAHDAHFLVGTSAAGNLLEAGLGWGQGQLVFDRGKDGAERAILAALPIAAAVRYDLVVIGSGDGVFAEFAAALQAAGVGVRVVSRQRSLSTALSLAVRDKRFLPEVNLRSGRLRLELPGCRRLRGVGSTWLAFDVGNRRKDTGLMASPGAAFVTALAKQTDDKVVDLQGQLRDQRMIQKFLAALSGALEAGRHSEALRVLAASKKQFEVLSKVDPESAVQLEALRAEISVVAADTVDDLPRTFPVAINEAGLALDPSSRHPKYTLLDEFIEVRFDKAKLETTVLPRDGRKTVLGIEPEVVVEHLVQEVNRLTGRPFSAQSVPARPCFGLQRGEQSKRCRPRRERSAQGVDCRACQEQGLPG